MLRLEKQLYDRVLDLLTPHMVDKDQRFELLAPALSVHRALNARIDWSGAPDGFTVRLVEACLKYGEVTDGKQALVLVLETVREEVGVAQQARIDALIGELTQLVSSEQVSPKTDTSPALDRAQVERWERMLGNYQRSLEMIEERMTEYVDPTEIPLQLILNKEKTEEKIAEIKDKLGRA